MNTSPSTISSETPSYNLTRQVTVNDPLPTGITLQSLISIESKWMHRTPRERGKSLKSKKRKLLIKKDEMDLAIEEHRIAELEYNSMRHYIATYCDKVQDQVRMNLEKKIATIERHMAKDQQKIDSMRATQQNYTSATESESSQSVPDLSSSSSDIQNCFLPHNVYGEDENGMETDFSSDEEGPPPPPNQPSNETPLFNQSPGYYQPPSPFPMHQQFYNPYGNMQYNGFNPYNMNYHPPTIRKPVGISKKSTKSKHRG